MWRGACCFPVETGEGGGGVRPHDNEKRILPRIGAISDFAPAQYPVQNDDAVVRVSTALRFGALLPNAYWHPRIGLLAAAAEPR